MRWKNVYEFKLIAAPSICRKINALLRLHDKKGSLRYDLLECKQLEKGIVLCISFEFMKDCIKET